MKIFDRLSSPTPKKWRNIGKACIAVSVFSAGFGAYADNESVIFGSFAFGVVGTFISNLFVEDGEA